MNSIHHHSSFFRALGQPPTMKSSSATGKQISEDRSDVLVVSDDERCASPSVVSV